MPDDHLAGEVPRLRAARTILDIAREAGVEEAAVVGDAALARRLTDMRRLVASAEYCVGWPGFRAAERVLSLLDLRSESPLETVSRLRLAANGVPAPKLQTEIVFRNGRRIGWTDFYWDEFGVVGEVDGKDKYRDDPFGIWWKEKKRHELLGETGLIVVRWGRAELDCMPLLVSRLWDAFSRGTRTRTDRGWIAIPTDPFAPRITA